MQDKITRCVDVASENCPCYLAETGDCLTCSRLMGKDECDCDWTGVCIYNEFILNGGKKVTARRERCCEIISKDEIIPGFHVMKIKTDRGFAVKCLNPGTHIFIRKAGTEPYYDVPMSLLAADYTEGSITIGVRVLSVKTKSLISADDGVIVRGPYRNGIIGLKGRISHRKILIAAAGAGAVPAVFASNLLSGCNETDVLLNEGALEKRLAKNFLSEKKNVRPSGIIFRDFENAADDLKTMATMKNGGYNQLIILGGDSFVEKIKAVASECLPEAYIAFSNNSVTCCGEGICGACAHINKEGRRIITCKCADPRLID